MDTKLFRRGASFLYRILDDVMPNSRSNTRLIEALLGAAAVATSAVGLSVVLSDLFTDISQFSLQVIASLVGAGAALASAIGLLTARAEMRKRYRKRIFIAYSREDRAFAENLADQLQKIGAIPLLDTRSINVGDDIYKMVEKMIDTSDYVIFVVSKNSAKSKWAQLELERALNSGVKLLPVVLQKDIIPSSIQNIVYADFTGQSTEGFDALRRALGGNSTKGETLA